MKRNCPLPQKSKPARPGKPKVTAAIFGISQHHRSTGSHLDAHDVDGVSNSILDIDFATTHGCMAIATAGDPDAGVSQAPAPAQALAMILRHCLAPIMNMVQLTLSKAPSRYPILGYAPHPNGVEL